jgi:hypothetical protein
MFRRLPPVGFANDRAGIDPDDGMSTPIVWSRHLVRRCSEWRFSVCPAHYDLDDVVQIGDRVVATNFNALPDRGTDAQDENLELVDDYSLRVRHRANLPHFGSFIFPETNRS